ncbi:hypothetical protein [Algoriphagus terrigena]|nr:hypothetical protein [Algoriphagus terrigena]
MKTFEVLSNQALPISRNQKAVSGETHGGEVPDDRCLGQRYCQAVEAN